MGKTAKKVVVKRPETKAGNASTQRGRRGASQAGPAQAAAHPHPPMAYRLHALLHTMHSIEHHEDHLCTLLTAMEREGAVSPALEQELATLLEELPGEAFVADLEAARRALAPPARVASKRKGA